jgi:hypothetical protein
MALATYDEIKDAVEAIQADDDSFKPLILTLGGAHWIATTVHGTMTALADLGWDAMEAVVETALAVPPWMTGKLTTFVRRLFDLLQDGVAFAAEAAEEVAETVAQGARSVAKFGVTAGRRAVTVARTGVLRVIGMARTNSRMFVRQTTRASRGAVQRQTKVAKRIIGSLR